MLTSGKERSSQSFFFMMWDSRLPASFVIPEQNDPFFIYYMIYHRGIDRAEFASHQGKELGGWKGALRLRRCWCHVSTM